MTRPSLARPVKVEPAKPVDTQNARQGFNTDLCLRTGATTTHPLSQIRLEYYMDQNFSFVGMALFTPVLA
jgi:hypothetical protein